LIKKTKFTYLSIDPKYQNRLTLKFSES